MPRLARRVSAVLGCLLLVNACVVQGETQPDPASTPAVSSAPLDWEYGHPERAAWSAALRQGIAAELARFGVPADIAEYCPTFASLDASGRTEALSVMSVAIAKRESAYDPAMVYGEPPPLSVDSIGLFQLSYEDGFSWCRLDRASDSLKDPGTNIACAVGEMARLVARDGVIASGSSSSDARGLARYWSVVRSGASHFKAEIQGKVKAMPICAG